MSCCDKFLESRYRFWVDNDEAPLPTCNNCPNFVFIPNRACRLSCNWGKEELNCITCIMMGAWILCPCSVRLRGSCGVYGEDRLHLDRHERQWEKRTWLIVHPTANLQRERNTLRAAQLWKFMPVSDLLTLIGTFYSAGITFEKPVAEAPRVGDCAVHLEEMPSVPDMVLNIYRETMAAARAQKPQ